MAFSSFQSAKTRFRRAPAAASDATAEAVRVHPDAEATGVRSEAEAGSIRPDAGPARIRPYRLTDRATVRRICCDNGCLGAPIDPVVADRDIFAAIFLDPYIDYRPDWAIVAEIDGSVVGYLVAAVDSGFAVCQVREGVRVFVKLLLRLLRKRGNLPPQDRRFLRWLLTRSWRERPRRPGTPAHMHFSIEDGNRGRYIAQRLWREFERRCAEAGIRHYFGEVMTADPEQVTQVYGRYGLRVFDRRRSTMLDGVVRRPVWTLCFAK